MKKSVILKPSQKAMKFLGYKIAPVLLDAWHVNKYKEQNSVILIHKLMSLYTVNRKRYF